MLGLEKYHHKIKDIFQLTLTEVFIIFHKKYVLIIFNNEHGKIRRLVDII